MAAPLQELVLGFDFGRRRIGVAVGQSLTGSASAETVLTTPPTGPDWTALEALVAQWQPARLLVGRPANMDGTDSQMTLAATEFATELGERTGLPVDLVDERLTSFEAREQLREQRRNGTKRRRVRSGELDAHAARLIVETWLRSRTTDT